MRYAHIITATSALLVMSLLVGCSRTNKVQSTDNQVKNPVIYQQPQSSLPHGITKNLSSYAQRRITRNELPLKNAVSEQGQLETISGDNVLYIGPQEVYAISQFRAVWNKLITKPIVVWVHTTPQIAKKEWNAAGYKSNPLPSPKTNYTQDLIPTPDAYHSIQSGWNELPGVLQAKEQTKWLEFFKGH